MYIPFMSHSRKRKAIITENKLIFARIQGLGRGYLDKMENEGSLGKIEMFYIMIVVVVATLYKQFLKYQIRP
jgi:hypothetical protein